MKYYYVFQDGLQIAQATEKERAITLIRAFQDARSDSSSKPEFSVIEGEEEIIPYPSQKKK